MLIFLSSIILAVNTSTSMPPPKPVLLADEAVKLTNLKALSLEQIAEFNELQTRNEFEIVLCNYKGCERRLFQRNFNRHYRGHIGLSKGEQLPSTIPQAKLDTVLLEWIPTNKVVKVKKNKKNKVMV